MTPSTKSESSLSKKKKKPGKKRRIALRKWVVIKKMAEETEKEKRKPGEKGKEEAEGEREESCGQSRYRRG